MTLTNRFYLCESIKENGFHCLCLSVVKFIIQQRSFVLRTQDDK
ncbi:MAG: hypothetical protein PWQ55_369 [Chloroflexota bacterium]|nr:hypothetical protein [Chloroflexota bacterium]